MVETATTPNFTPCPDGGNHQWFKLGHSGPLSYTCSKCGVTVKLKDPPREAPCAQGGMHEWHKSGEDAE